MLAEGVILKSKLRRTRVICKVTGAPLTVDGEGLIHGLSEAQAVALEKCGYVRVGGDKLSPVKAAVDAFGRLSASLAEAEDKVVAALRSAREKGATDEQLDGLLAAAGKAHQTVLPRLVELIGSPAPAKPAEPPPAPAKPAGKPAKSVEPPAVVESPAAPKE